jgi:hypothetical protein
MTLYYLKQDDTIWGCGESGCCGEYYEEISESFVDCNCEVKVNAEHLHECNGGGPVLEWRKAYGLETQAYEDGKSEGWSDGANWGEKNQIERIIKLLENRTNDSGSVLDETGNSIADISDLIELIKGETK